MRKQVYLREDQERLLKQRARELGLSEAELIRQAVDRFLAFGGPSGREEVLEAFLEEAERLSQTHRFPENFRFRREEVYAEREGRVG